MLRGLLACASIVSSASLISSIILIGIKTPPLLLSQFLVSPLAHIESLTTFPEMIEELSLLEFQLMIDLSNITDITRVQELKYSTLIRIINNLNTKDIFRNFIKI